LEQCAVTALLVCGVFGVFGFIGLRPKGYIAQGLSLGIGFGQHGRLGLSLLGYREGSAANAELNDKFSTAGHGEVS
jgi:hypothetical protein